MARGAGGYIACRSADYTLGHFYMPQCGDHIAASMIDMINY